MTTRHLSLIITLPGGKLFHLTQLALGTAQLVFFITSGSHAAFLNKLNNVVSARKWQIVLCQEADKRNPSLRYLQWTLQKKNNSASALQHSCCFAVASPDFLCHHASLHPPPLKNSTHTPRNYGRQKKNPCLTLNNSRQVASPSCSGMLLTFDYTWVWMITSSVFLPLQAANNWMRNHNIYTNNL